MLINPGNPRTPNQMHGAIIIAIIVIAALLLALAIG